MVLGYAPEITDRLPGCCSSGAAPDLYIVATHDLRLNAALLQTLLQVGAADKPIIAEYAPYGVEGTDRILIPLDHKWCIILPLRQQRLPRQVVKHLPAIGALYSFNMASCAIPEGILQCVRSSDSKFHPSSLRFLLEGGGDVFTVPCRQYATKGIDSFEDPRLFTIRGRLYLMYVYTEPYIIGTPTCTHLKVDEIEVVRSGGSVEIEVVRSWVPKYGGNLGNGPEKNWTFWEGPRGKIHCLYAPWRGELLEFDDFGREPQRIPDAAGVPGARGGAPGVVVGDKVWCFVHFEGSMSVGVLVYSWTDTPVLLGYNKSVFETDKACGAFFYVCGALLTGSHWRLTGGWTDAKPGILEVAVEDVEAGMTWI